MTHYDTRAASLLPVLLCLRAMGARTMSSIKARTLNKIIDISTTMLFYTPVIMLVYGYIGRECVRYTVKGVRERLSR